MHCFLQGLEFSIILLVWVIPNARNPNILCYLTYIWFISFTHSIKQKERGYFKHIDADIFDEYKPEEMPKCFIQLAWSNHIRDSVTKRWISFKTYLSWTAGSNLIDTHPWHKLFNLTWLPQIGQFFLYYILSLQKSAN